MATRNRPMGFRGGISRWVTREEVRQFAEELAALETLAGLAEWSEATPCAPAFISYRVRLLETEPDQVPLSDSDRKRVLLDTVVDVACVRRGEAIREHAREHRISVPAAMGTGRCPVCNAPDDLDGIYCRAHRDDQEAEVWDLLGHEPAGDTNWRPLGL